MRKYIEIFKYSMKMKLTFIYDYLFSLFSFGIHVFVFNELWDYILQGKTLLGYTRKELIWYIIIAEFITFSNEKIFKKISSMIKQGDIANMLIKPVDMVNYFIAENTAVIIKAVVNFVFGMVFGIVLLGPMQISFMKFVMFLIASLLGIFIGNLIQILIGITAFYTEENNSIYLILQKLSFFCVFTPLEFYPKIVQKIFAFLPTTYYIYTPAKIFANASNTETVKLFTAEIASGILIFIIIRILYQKGVKKINVNGG